MLVGNPVEVGCRDVIVSDAVGGTNVFVVIVFEDPKSEEIGDVREELAPRVEGLPRAEVSNVPD